MTDSIMTVISGLHNNTDAHKRNLFFDNPVYWRTGTGQVASPWQKKKIKLNFLKIIIIKSFGQNETERGFMDVACNLAAGAR